VTSEPTPGEVDRALQQLRTDVREDIRDLASALRDGLAGINSRLDKTPSLDVYQVDKLRAEERHGDLRERIKGLEDERVATARTRTTERRWVIGAVILPIGVALTDLWLKVTGRL
jgi:hypothetical protein